MKKYLAALTAFLLSATLVSCGTDEANGDTSGKEESSVSETTESEREPDSSSDTEKETSRTEESSEDEEHTIGIDLSDAEVKNVSRVALKGTFSSDTYFRNLYNVNVLHTGVVGLFGCPVEISSSDFTEGSLVFEYKPDDMKNVPPENLIVLHYNEEEQFYDTVESSLNSEKNIVKAEISEAGTYLLADAFEWYGVWGEDVSEYAHDTVYTDSDFNFRICIPEEISLKYVSDYLKDDEEGKCQTLLECYSNDNIQIGIEYLERPDYASAQEFVGIIADTLDDYLISTGSVTAKDSTTGYYFYLVFDEYGDKGSYSMNCIYPIDNTHYINIWYGFTDKAYYDKAMASVESFEFIG